MRWRAFVIGLVLVVASATVWATCLKYEPTRVELSGKIIKKTFAGPPNFESIKNGDAEETYWILVLESPICVDASKDDELNSEAASGVTEVQLVMKEEQYKKYRPLLGKNVKVVGTLYHAHTAYHKTPVLLTLEEIKAGA